MQEAEYHSRPKICLHPLVGVVWAGSRRDSLHAWGLMRVAQLLSTGGRGGFGLRAGDDSRQLFSKFEQEPGPVATAREKDKRVSSGDYGALQQHGDGFI